jgi:hypothetical protein
MAEIRKVLSRLYLNASAPDDVALNLMQMIDASSAMGLIASIQCLMSDPSLASVMQIAPEAVPAAVAAKLLAKVIFGATQAKRPLEDIRSMLELYINANKPKDSRFDFRVWLSPADEEKTDGK